MIRDHNIADDANIQPHKILGGMASAVNQYLTGELFWVGDSGDAAYNAMRTKVAADHLFTSLDTAVGSCVANRGDVIVCMEGFSETVSAAAGLDLDVAGITIVFLGTGTSQAYITFTATDADMDIDAADITLINPKFVAGIDALTGPIDVNSTDFTIINGEYHDYTDMNTVDAIIATSGATRLKIDGYKYFKSNEGGTQKESHIQLNGVDDFILRNINVEGDFDTGVLENVTDECLRMDMSNIVMKNTDAGNAPCMVLDSACTGWATNVRLRNANGTVVSDNADINWGPDCLGFSTDGAGGEPIGTADSSSIEGKVDIIDGYHDVPVADTSDNDQMRDVIGNKDDAAAAAAVTTAESLMAYVKQCVGANIVIDGFHDVPTKDTSTNAQLRDVIGNKTDTAAAAAVSETESLMAYAKQNVTLAIARDTAIGTIDGYHDVPTKDTSTNAQARDVIGNKTDSAAGGAVSETESLMAYAKQNVTLAIARDTAIGTIDGYHDIPTADTSDNAQMRDVIGNKTDAAAAGAVSATESLMAYAKQCVSATLVATADTSDNTQMSEVVGNKTDAAASGAVSATESLMAYAKQLVSADNGLSKNHPNYLTVVADQSSATWNAVAAHEIATVTGMVRMRVVPEITAALGNDSDTATLALGTASDPDGFIEATTATGLDADQVWWSSTDSDNKKFVSKDNVVDFIVNAEDVGYTVGTTATTAGSITFHIWWEPLDSTGAVAAGAGGTFA